ncbi:MAG: SIS domain-containing protein, partial [Actinomycetota bacterium]
VPAFWNHLPELDHNEIEGWGNGSELVREHFTVVLLRDADEHQRNALRFDVTKRLIEPLVSDIVELRSEGSSALARLFSMVFVTQLASIYVGLARGIDPGPVNVLESLKNELAKER